MAGRLQVVAELPGGLGGADALAVLVECAAADRHLEEEVEEGDQADQRYRQSDQSAHHGARVRPPGGGDEISDIVRAMIRPLAAVLGACLLLSASDALAQRRNPLIAQGQEQYDDLRYEEALQTLSAALVRAGNSEQDRSTIYRLLAFTYLALGREEEAEGAYRSLLAIEPEFQPGSDVSPRIRDFFGGVRQRWEQEGRPGVAQRPPAPLNIRHRSPPQARRNTAVSLEAQVEDPDGRLAGLVLAYRQGTSAVFTRLEAQLRGGSWYAQVPAAAVRPPLVEYYFEAVDAAGLPIAQRGDVAAPLRIAVPAPESGGLLSQWWFWTVVGVVVVGGIVGAVLILGGDEGGQQTGTFVIRVE